jgi:3-oxoacyl-[acyl-carrier protein] reductase
MPVIALLGGGAGIGRAMALGLLNLGHRVSAVAPATDLTRRGKVERALAELSPIRAVVLVHDDPVALEPEPLVEMPEILWRRRCETPLRVTLACMQAAHASMRQRGGRIILVIPSIAMTGAAGLVPTATAAEGVRSLAKAAARGWGQYAITVNCVAFDVDGASRTPPALSKADVPAVVSMLLSEQAATVTGTTVAADAGRWMPS